MEVKHFDILITKSSSTQRVNENPQRNSAFQNDVIFTPNTWQ